MCLALGFATPAEAQARINSREFAEWMAYYQIEPFGQDRGDASAAIVAHTIAACNGVKNTTPADFMPRFGEPETKRASGEQMLVKARAFAARFKAFGGGRR